MKKQFANNIGKFNLQNWIHFILIAGKYYHRDDGCYWEFKRSQHFALNNLSWNFIEAIMNANKVIPENVVDVR